MRNEISTLRFLGVARFSLFLRQVFDMISWAAGLLSGITPRRSVIGSLRNVSHPTRSHGPHPTRLIALIVAAALVTIVPAAHPRTPHGWLPSPTTLIQRRCRPSSRAPPARPSSPSAVRGPTRLLPLPASGPPVARHGYSSRWHRFPVAPLRRAQKSPWQRSRLH